MNRYLKLHLKIFLGTGIPFGIFMGIFYSLEYGFPLSLVAGLFREGIIFGVFMSLICGFMHSWSVKRMPYGKSEESLGVYHVRNVELRLPYDKAFNLCIESISSIKKCKIQTEDCFHGKIVAKAGSTWKTWGDVISFKARKIDNGRTQVVVSSRPAMRTTLVDCGKNLENVERISSFLNEQSEIAYNSR